ncbi:N-acetylmuramoyl-L-alanine amidase family protein [Veillonella agrestimuris]|uniref:N-acetylmuramoyl-L-alanine amidase family protein n=1 Tax=Veillonella agrestimuris TaxID=2941340 RepID=UPI00203BCA32|nr:N-acetylmuramoyl-L-alanine amidase [Veillonella agrestimuris]
MRKLFLMCFAFFMALPLLLSQAKAADLQDTRWVTRTDAPIPYVRMVMDLSAPVKAAASISKDGKTTTVTLKNTKLKTSKRNISMDSSIASSAQFVQAGKDVKVTIKTPSALETEDLKVFSLKKDTVNKKPYRIVVDLQKKGVAPKQVNYGKKPSPATLPASSKNAGSGNYSTSGGLKGKVITIDPGHGGSDPGAIGPTGYQEKQATLPISNYLKTALEARGAKVFMTRTTDVDVYGPHASGADELGARVRVANANNSDAFISVHINSFTNPSVGGIATYYYSKTSNDARLAQKIQNEIADTPGFKGDRGIQEGNLYVLRHSKMPAVLVELGFISNPQEERALKNAQTEQDFANRIANGIANYFGG